MGSLTTGSPRGPAAFWVAGLNVQSGHRKWAETILITGGLGGLGLELAKHLADEGASHLVLTSRRERPEHAGASTAQPTALQRT